MPQVIADGGVVEGVGGDLEGIHAVAVAETGVTHARTNAKALQWIEWHTVVGPCRGQPGRYFVWVLALVSSIALGNFDIAVGQ
ncbi:hypothetical protein D3C76_1595330 [compost metagenome]